MTLNTYSFELATKVVFGPGTIEEAGREAKKLGMTKAMIIADQGIIHAGLTAPVEAALLEEDIHFVIYDKIVPNPRDFHCLEGAEFGREHEIDGMIAIGGGSSIDTAKAIGTLMTNGKDIRTWAGLNLLEREIPPLIAIPTTAGTGSEVTFDAVITDTKTHEKLNILDLKIAPKVALVDPQTLLKLPSRAMAACGIDALVHAVEAYTCKAACPHTDAYALYAIDIIQKNLRSAVESPDIDNCTGMALGSTMAGIAFGYSDVAAVHCIAEALGGRYDTPHGVANAIMLPVVTEFNIPSNLEKYANMAKYLAVDTSNLTKEEAAYSCVGALQKLCEDVKIPKMREVEGISPVDFPELAEASFRNISTLDNPRDITVDDYLYLLNKAYFELSD